MLRSFRTRIVPALLLLAVALGAPDIARAQDAPPRSIAREWNELLLQAIRDDLARPTVHARNLFHVSIAMWDAWAAYEPSVATYLHHERAVSDDVAEARRIALSHAAYRILRVRFLDSPGAPTTLPALDQKMRDLGLDHQDTRTKGDTPAALGNRIAETVLAFGRHDGANERNDYANRHYRPANPPLVPPQPGNPDLRDPNRWQPLSLEGFIDQSGNVVAGGAGEFLSPEWGAVTAFALLTSDRTTYERLDVPWHVFHDPGPPPLLGGAGDDEYRDGFLQVVLFSGALDPSDGVLIDISPASRGNSTLGTNDGSGRPLNPATGAPYEPQIVPAGDYYRVLAEFWADGPDSETPPGHWFVIANEVNDHPDLERRLGGVGPELDPLEWDVKLYLTLSGAVHDAAVAAWGVKGWYDYIRPISAIRGMADLGQSSDPDGPSYHPEGIPLVPGRVEVVTEETASLGGHHFRLRGSGGENVGKIALRAWRGPDFIDDPETDTAGVAWILAENWWPYQRPSFVTPPFAGYVSGHSTFSRAAAEVLTAFTGSAYFPGGVGEFPAPRNEFLVFEEGPSVDLTLQWATYFDAADECSLSRIYGGIHPRADDLPGRLMGAEIGRDAFARALQQFAPDPVLEIERARARPRARRRGMVRVHGKVDLASGGVLDMSRGLAMTVDYGAGHASGGSVTAAELRLRDDGTVVVRAKDGSIRGKLRPLDPSFGELGFTFDLKVRVRGYGRPAAAPLVVRIQTPDGVREGTIGGCVQHGRRRRPKLTWNPLRTQ